MRKIVFALVAAVLLLFLGLGTDVAVVHAQEPRACIQVLCSNGNEVLFCGNPKSWDNVISAVCGQPNGNNS